jgi:hypothetical protein
VEPNSSNDSIYQEIIRKNFNKALVNTIERNNRLCLLLGFTEQEIMELTKGNKMESDRFFDFIEFNKLTHMNKVEIITLWRLERGM